MKQKLRFLMMTLLCAVAGSLWAAETTDEFIFTSREWSATRNGEVDNWAIGLRANGYTAGQGTQVTTSATGDRPLLNVASTSDAPSSPSATISHLLLAVS